MAINDFTKNNAHCQALGNSSNTIFDVILLTERITTIFVLLYCLGTVSSIKSHAIYGQARPTYTALGRPTFPTLRPLSDLNSNREASYLRSTTYLGLGLGFCRGGVEMLGGSQSIPQWAMGDVRLVDSQCPTPNSEETMILAREDKLPCPSPTFL